MMLPIWLQELIALTLLVSIAALNMGAAMLWLWDKSTRRK